MGEAPTSTGRPRRWRHRSMEWIRRGVRRRRAARLRRRYARLTTLLPPPREQEAIFSSIGYRRSARHPRPPATLFHGALLSFLLLLRRFSSFVVVAASGGESCCVLNQPSSSSPTTTIHWWHFHNKTRHATTFTPAPLCLLVSFDSCVQLRCLFSTGAWTTMWSLGAAAMMAECCPPIDTYAQPVPCVAGRSATASEAYFCGTPRYIPSLRRDNLPLGDFLGPRTGKFFVALTFFGMSTSLSSSPKPCWPLTLNPCAQATTGGESERGREREERRNAMQQIN